jgi:hypothetical protein
MTQPADQLRDAFSGREHLTPQPAEVYAGALELARGYRRRRRTAQAAGGAVLGAGLVAGGLAVPGILASMSPAARPVQTVPLTVGAAPAALVPQSQQQQEQDWQAYFAAGYGYDDALELARIWQVSAEPGAVKAEAGRRLLAGETLPIKPGPETGASPSTLDSGEAAAVDAFFAAGYTYADAVKLAALWNVADPYQAKAEAGRKLLDGQRLPIAP